VTQDFGYCQIITFRSRPCSIFGIDFFGFEKFLAHETSSILRSTFMHRFKIKKYTKCGTDEFPRSRSAIPDEHHQTRVPNTKRNRRTTALIDQAIAGRKMAACLYRLSRAPVLRSSWPYR